MPVSAHSVTSRATADIGTHLHSPPLSVYFVHVRFFFSFWFLVLEFCGHWRAFCRPVTIHVFFPWNPRIHANIDLGFYRIPCWRVGKVDRSQFFTHRKEVALQNLRCSFKSPNTLHAHIELLLCSHKVLEQGLKSKVHNPLLALQVSRLPASMSLSLRDQIQRAWDTCELGRMLLSVNWESLRV
jgi:hypothetical protein